MQGWSKSESLNWLHSGSKLGSRQRQVGRKNWNPWRVLSAAWHFITVVVEHATEKKKRKKKFDIKWLTKSIN